MENIPSAIFVLMSVVLIIEGAFLVIKGRVKRKFAVGYDILYEGGLVRVLGVLFILLGAVIGMGATRIISINYTLSLFFLILMPASIIGFVVQQKSTLLKK